MYICLYRKKRDREKLRKCDKVAWHEKCHYANDILFEWPDV